MPTQERAYWSGSGEELILKSARTISRDSWQLTLELYGPGFLRRRLVERRVLLKSGRWSTAAIVLLQAQEELEILEAAGVEIQLVEILRPS